MPRTTHLPSEKIVSEKRPLRKIRDLDDKISAARGKPEIFAAFRKSIARQTRGFKAPEHCIRAIEAAVNLPFPQGLQRERAVLAAAPAQDHLLANHPNRCLATPIAPFSSTIPVFVSITGQSLMTIP